MTGRCSLPEELNMAVLAMFILLLLASSGHVRASVLGRLSRSAAAHRIRLEAEFTFGMYHLEYSLGTPPVAVQGVLDSATAMSWIMCDPQGKPTYNPNHSSTAAKLPCHSPRCNLGKYASNCTEFCTYENVYGDENYAQGTMLTETVTLGGVSVPDMLIGCTSNTSMLGEPGNVGFAPSGLSMIGQLGLKKFSHCLAPPDASKKSPVFLGWAAELSCHGALGTIKSVPLVDNPQKGKYYWISLKAISVGNTRVEIAGEAPDGTELMVVDTGTDMSTFAKSTFDKLRDAFVKEAKLPTKSNQYMGIGEGLCFVTAGSDQDVITSLPKVTYHLDGVDQEFPADAFYTPDVTGLTCVKVRGMGEHFKFPAIWGNHQMRNMHMMFDLGQQRMSFVPADCSTL